MEKRLRLIFVSLLVLLFCQTAGAQGKVYTRKARLADFPTRTVKVAGGGNPLLDITFREEISTRWRISPYEFCTAGEMEQLKGDNSLYFLYLGVDSGITYIVLEKGGNPQAENNLSRPFEVVRVPISCAGAPSGRELMYMGAFIDILQAYVEDAMVSDQAAYAGLGFYDRNFKGKTVCLDPDRCDELYMQADSDTLICVTVSPHEPSPEMKCYRMLISADTHELFSFRESKYKTGKETEFSENEIKRISKNNEFTGE